MRLEDQSMEHIAKITIGILVTIGFCGITGHYGYDAYIDPSRFNFVIFGIWLGISAVMLILVKWQLDISIGSRE